MEHRKQKTRDRDRISRSDPDDDNTYYVQLTTGQTMRNNILVCDGNNSIIARVNGKFEPNLHYSVNLLYVFHFHCIPYSRAHTHTCTIFVIPVLYYVLLYYVCMLYNSLTFTFPKAILYNIYAFVI